MKKITMALYTIRVSAFAAALFVVGMPVANALTLDFASIAEAPVQFVGSNDTFSFLSVATGNGFRVTGSDGFGDSINLYGSITGPYHIGTIASTSTPLGTLQSALVTGSGILSIWDASNIKFTADLKFDYISTLGQTGGINAEITGSNMTNFIYNGTNQDLLALLGAKVAMQGISFQFVPAKSLTYLTTDGRVTETSYSGNISAVPLPAAVWLFGSALLGISGIGRRNHLMQEQKNKN